MPTPNSFQALALVQGDYLPQVNPAAVEQAMMIGDLSQMSPEVRVAYYIATCKSLGLNPLTKPFQALKTDSGEIHLYPDKGCAEQLRKRDRISLRIVSREYVEDLYIVTVEATTPDGRKEEAEGIAVVMEAAGTWKEGTKRDGSTYRYKQDLLGPDGEPLLKRLSGTAMANARMRAETKAKRRVTLAICGLGIPDMDTGHPMRFDPQHGTLSTEGGVVDVQTGEIIEGSRLLDAPAEKAKGLQQHIGDLYGDAPPAPLHPIWATIAGWYTESGIPEKYAEYEAWACRRYRVGHIAEMQEQDLKDMAAKVYATLEPLIVARKTAQGTTNGQEEEGLTIGSSMPASVPREAMGRLKNDNGEDATSQGPSWVDADRNLFDEEEQAERAAMREEGA